MIDYLFNYFIHVHIYLIIKIPDENNSSFIKSEKGLENFSDLINILKPVYTYWFYDFHYHYYNDNDKFSAYNSQIKLIDMCINKALEYERNNNIKYDIFFRIRPDSCFLMNDIKINEKIENKIYTSIKNDAVGNDQVFLFNQFILYEWWINYVKKIIVVPILVPPEYIIFKEHDYLIEQSFQNWLVRNYNEAYSLDWSSQNKKPLNSEYVWNNKEDYNKLLITISHSDFINNITKIVNYQIGQILNILD